MMLRPPAVEMLRGDPGGVEVLHCSPAASWA